MSKRKLEALYKRVQGFVVQGSARVRDHVDTLQRAAEIEARQQAVPVDAQGFTPRMRETCVNPKKQEMDKWNRAKEAYDAVAVPYMGELREKIESGKDARVNIPRKKEEEKDKIEESALQDSRYASAEEEKDKADEEYETLRKKYGREAKTFPIVLYLFGLFGLGVAEWFINYSTFRGAYGIPIVAAGFTAAVAAAFAFASHFHGTFLRQHNYVFGEQVPRLRRRVAMFTLIFFSLMVLIGLVFVAWSRYAWIVDQIQATRGGEGDSAFRALGGQVDANVQLKVFMSVAGNVIVWLVGVGMAWLVHDEDPEFPRAKRSKDKAQRVFERRRRPYDDQLRASATKFEHELRQEENLLKENERELVALTERQATIDRKHSSVCANIGREVLTDVQHYKNHFCNSALNSATKPSITKAGESIGIEAYQESEPVVDVNYLFSASDDAR